ncbi:MAG: carbohydrate-binding domain-containing protein, partial [Lachnospiraceae bacterium]|nr:carbohydrate-binding domain-containing protein [Lachnospiraceae bacterium]
MAAFNCCKNLTTITFKSATPPNIGQYVFNECTALTTIYVPSGSLEAYKAVTNLTGTGNMVGYKLGTEFAGGVKTDKTEYTYGETITVTVTPTATDTIVPQTFALTPPAAEQIALFIGETQMTEPQAAPIGTELTFTVNTKDTALKIGKHTITAKYIGGANSIDCVGTVTVTLNAKLIISTTALDFTKTADEGGWSATATVEDNGYHWEGDAANGYTLTLGNLNLTAGIPIILPDADVGIVLKGKTTLNAEMAGIYCTGTASGHTVTISGDGSLSTTSENNKGINIVQNLSITGGTLDMKGRTGGIYSNGDIEISGGTVTAASTDYASIASNGTITISGGTVNADSTNNVGIHAIEAVKISGGSVTAKGGLTAILGRTGITLTGMRITNPAGAAVGDSVNDAPSKAIMLNGKDVLDVTMGEIKLEFKGEGTEASPYEISTAKELADLAAAVNNGKADYISAHYKLTADIDLSGIPSWTPIGTYVIGNAEATKPFKGTFDGNGKTIRNLKINAPSAI